MILYINTKDPKVVTVALKEKSKIIKKLTDHNQYGSQALLPLIVKLLKQARIDFKDIESVELETGPGSFTGLKVGASVANALGFSLGIPVNRKGIELNLQY